MLEPHVTPFHTPRDSQCRCGQTMEAGMDEADDASTLSPKSPAEALEVSRVHHWISGQQHQLHQDSELLVQLTSIYPIGKAARGARSFTFGNNFGEGGSSAGDAQEEVFSVAPRRAYHDESCPCYEDIPMPVYQEVDPITVSSLGEFAGGEPGIAITLTDGNPMGRQEANSRHRRSPAFGIE